ncbi:MAG: Response regulator receiver domain protein [candidate division WS6 bacterium GW2011_GWA2_37_6]|uniref:Response regulator receiver domain protein n=1 Tax=candidate division WS6 bacterium GW2011_GWA2_37_6 TaxID=1619087 RepID=A0A0G0H9I0_9BACT|nr:MAG: Response regulator receiver domain protein [candidate division WS6 bacterium GW2011_GWA2_37_6]
MEKNKPYSILICEDDLNLRNLLSLKLKNEGYEILSAAEGSAGLEMALEKKPDLILLDLLMPGMKGDAVLAALRNDPWGKTAKVIILTNVSNDDKMMKEIGANNPVFYLVKSDNSLKELIDKIKETFQEE